MNTYYSQLQIPFLFWISLLLCLNPEVTHGVTEDTLEFQESEEFENALVRGVRHDFQNGFVGLVNFINSLNITLTALNTKLAAQDTEFGTLNAKIDAIDTKLATVNLNMKVQSTLNNSINNHLTAVDTKVDRLKTNTNWVIRKVARNNPPIREDFDILIETRAKEITTGKSFNGSTLSNIKSRASQFGQTGSYSVIVFVNHLDEAIDDFTIYDPYNTTYNPAPKSIQGRNKEVFTFAHPSWYPEFSFSYAIPSLNIRIAAIIDGGTNKAGLAFVHNGTSMKTYYGSKKGIEGSAVYECCAHLDRNLSVVYRNFHARMFAENAGIYKATLRIELIKVPLDD